MRVGVGIVRIAWIVASALGAIGCDKDAEIHEFLAAHTRAAVDVEVAWRCAEDGAGEASAERALAARRGDVTRRWEAIRDARGYQVREETRRHFERRVKENVAEICKLPSKRLCDDFVTLAR
jgi:hypothetical protein